MGTFDTVNRNRIENRMTDSYDEEREAKEQAKADEALEKHQAVENDVIDFLNAASEKHGVGWGYLTKVALSVSNRRDLAFALIDDDEDEDAEE